MTEDKGAKGKRTVQVILFLAFISLFILITYQVAWQMSAGRFPWIDRLDEDMGQWLYGIRNPGLTTWMELLTYVGNWESITVICLLLLIYPKSRMNYGISTSAAAILTTIIKAVIKPVLERARPDEAYHLIQQGGYSYPSGHAITGVAVFAVLAVMLYKHRKENKGNMEKKKKKEPFLIILCIGLGLGIGLSRIYLGVHYATDVLGAWCAGLAVAVVVIMVMEAVETRWNPQWQKPK